MHEVVSVEVLQAYRDIYELNGRREPVNILRAGKALTKPKGLCPGFSLRNFVIFPFSIHGEMMRCGFEVTPTKGRILSWWSHFHPTTSFARHCPVE